MVAQRIDERLTFDQLFRVSDPQRVARSFKVRGPPLEIDSYQDTVYYIFNFKANPSTTGLRHKGYVKFFKPKSGRQTPLQHVDCLVDCTCPDYRHRWAWANKQRQSSLVGPQSLNQAWNKAPRKTNPKGKPGLCKHILAAREYIYGLLSSFPGDQPDTAEKLNKLTRYATKRWTNFPELVQQAKAREREIRQRIAQRNILGRVVEPEEAEPIGLEAPPLPPAPAAPAAPQQPARPERPKAPEAFKKAQPEPLPSTMPYGASGPTEPLKRPAGRPRRPIVGPYGMPLPKPEPRRRPKLGDALARAPKNFLGERVVRAANDGEIMNSLLEAKQIVQELEDDQIAMNAAPDAMGGVDSEMGVDPLEPSEPPISDTAIGADTEGETALGLLRQMRDLLAQLVSVEAPEMPGSEEGGAPPMGGEGELEGESAMPPLPPSDEVPSEDASGEGSDDEDEGGGEDDEKPRNRRPVD